MKCSFLTEEAEGLGQGVIHGLARDTFPSLENLNSICKHLSEMRMETKRVKRRTKLALSEKLKKQLQRK